MFEWLNEVREYIIEQEPELLQWFDVYIAEAKFGRQYLDDDLRTLSQEANILEVGAGALILSCQLVREGYHVTALEPTGSGFSHLDKLRMLVIDKAIADNCSPTLLTCPAERLFIQNQFDYAFSINVMEHVTDVTQVLNTVGQSLICGGKYRFTCPNYSFPYEPHFNCVTLFSKSLTAYWFVNKIFKNQSLPDPKGMWESLNWITSKKIRQYGKNKYNLNIQLHKTFVILFERMLNDSLFSQRRSRYVANVIVILVKLRLHHLIGLLPVSIHPMIDCSIVRKYEVLEKEVL